MHFIDRDISWLSFNERVLQEAADSNNPLMERLKFLAIYSSNLEEFYRVRVAHQRHFAFAEVNKPNKFGYRPSEILKTIYRTVDKQQRTFGKLFYKEILPGLSKKGVLVVQDFEKKEHIKAALSLFEQLEEKIKIKHITRRKEVFLKNQGNYLFLVTKKRVAFKYHLIELEDELGRFHLVEKGNNRHVFLLDDVIRMGLKHNTFHGRFVDAFALKLSRDADLYLEDEPLSKDLKEKIIDSLKKRESGTPTRLLFDELMPYKFLNDLMVKTKSDKEALVPGGRYHKFYDFFGFPDLPDPTLYYPKAECLASKALSAGQSVLETIAKKDLLFAFPYQSYNHVLEVLKEAAEHPGVRSIKITLYRVASDSEVCMLLERAAKNGKKIVVYTELKARFDESSNIYWNKRLKKAGAQLYDTVNDLKTHAKIFQIEVENKGVVQCIAHLGTGNFNEKTASLYTDFSLLTANEKINAEVASVFEFLTGKTKAYSTQLLLGAPFNLREQIKAKIKEEMAMKAKGKKARILLKLNSLEDPEIIDLLYKAAHAGVQIDLIVRGICCLKPGVKGLSENINLVSIVGRFLEHARCYYFHQGGAGLLYCSSADFMSRNLDRRVEIAFPIMEKNHKAFMLEFLELQLKDNTNQRVLDEHLSNKRHSNSASEEVVNAQVDIQSLIRQFGL
jgi:polyphosphate kinase